jgi:RNA polymerase sigma factor (sigma-70 family)
MHAIYQDHKDHLLTLARSLVNDRALAEDVVHDVFVSFVLYLPQLRLHGSLKGYLSISVCNRVRDHFRRKGRQQERMDGHIASERIAVTPETHLSQEEAAQRLRAALQQIPLEQREVVLLRIKADLPFNDIAAQQGINANAARARYRYGIEKLRTLLDGETQV